MRDGGKMEDGRFNEILSMKFLRCESIDGGGAERPLHCSRCMWGCGSGSDRDRRRKELQSKELQT